MSSDPVEILFKYTGGGEDIVGSSGMGRDVHSLTLSIQHFSADHDVAHPPKMSDVDGRDNHTGVRERAFELRVKERDHLHTCESRAGSFACE